MSRVIIVHGWGGSPESDFLPWAKEEFRKKGYEVVTPSMPDLNYPKIETWVPYLKEVVGKAKSTDIFIGHSIGVSTILRYLETSPESVKVEKVIMVAPWAVSLSNLDDSDDEETAKPWLETPINFEKVKTKADEFIAIFSDNDPYVPLDENKKVFGEKLNAEIFVEHSKGHFNNMPQERPNLMELSL